MGITLVTGASGFVGSHLMDEMKRRSLPVRGITRGVAAQLISVPSYGPGIDWTNCLADVDTVVHLAARVHVMHETAPDPLSLFREANVIATMDLARQAAHAGVRRFVFVSSIKVNGERTDPGKPFTADDPPNPQDPYSISKAEAENALMKLAEAARMEVTIIRTPLVYGTGVKGNFRTLMRWANSICPSPFSKVANKRSLIHVRNLCDLLVEVLTHGEASNQVFLASDNADMSTHELLVRLKESYGRSTWSVPIPPWMFHYAGSATGQSGVVARLTESLQVDIDATCNILNWYPPLKINETMRLL